MNIAVITAGGIGARMGADIPKQFIEILGKPVIAYTLEKFQDNSNIDAIILVCVEEWQDTLIKIVNDCQITKVYSIIKGGLTNFESIKKGVIEANRLFGENEVIIMHDGIRPNITGEVIDDSIRVCREYGNSVSAIDCVEVMMTTNDKISSKGHIPRESLMRAQTPQSFYIKDLISLYREAEGKGITNSTSLCSLVVELGKKTYFSKGSETNVKLTVPDDIEIFKALLEGSYARRIKK